MVGDEDVPVTSAAGHRPSAAHQRRIFEPIWSTGHGRLSAATELRLGPVRRFLVGRVLDIGAGDGQVASFRPDADVISIDLTLASCRRLVGGGRPAVRADASALPFRDQSFDTVVMLEVLEHVPDPLETLVQIRHALKPGGTLILSTPNDELSLVERIFYLLWKRVWPTRRNLHRWDPFHLRRFAVPELTALVDRAGLTLQSTRLWAKSGFAFGQYFVDLPAQHLGLPPTAAYFARLDAYLPGDNAANIVLVARRSPLAARHC